MSRLLLIILAILLALILLAAILLTVLLDKDKVLELATTTLREQTGATLVVRGETSLSLFPTLGVSLADASLSLPGDRQSQVDARLLEIGVELMPLLSRRIEIGGIRVDGLDARLYQAPSADGSPEPPPAPDLPADVAPPTGGRPAQAGDADSTAAVPAPTPALTIDQLDISDSRITLVDPAAATETVVEINRLQASDLNTEARPIALRGTVALPDQGISLVLDGAVRLDLPQQQLLLDGIELAVEGPTPEPLALKATGTVNLASQDTELQLTLASGAASGEAHLLYTAPGLDAAAVLETSGSLQSLDVAQLLTLAAVDADLSGTAALSWELSGTGASNEELAASVKGPIELALTRGSFNGQPLNLTTRGRINMKQTAATMELEAALGETRATGEVAYNGGGSPQIDAKLHLNLLDPALLALAGPDAAEQAPASSGDDTGDEPLPLELIRTIDTLAELTVDKAVYEAHTVENLVLKLRAAQGVVRVSTFTGEVHGGKLDMKAVFNASEDPARLNTRGGIEGVDIARLLTALETEPLLAGSANLEWQLNSKGVTPNELFSDLRGPITLSADESVLKALGIERELCEAVALVNQEKISTPLPEQSTFRTLGVDIRMGDGKATLSAIKAQLPHLGLTGQGVVDLLQDEFRVDFKARLKPSLAKLDPACRVNERLTAIDWPMDCRGQLSGDPAEWCSVQTEDIIADMARNEARRKVEKEAERALKKLFDK